MVLNVVGSNPTKHPTERGSLKVQQTSFLLDNQALTDKFNDIRVITENSKDVTSSV